PAPPETATLCLHDALPMYAPEELQQVRTPRLDPEVHRVARYQLRVVHLLQHVQLETRVNVREQHERCASDRVGYSRLEVRDHSRSEEHTSELQSRENLVCR